VVVPAVVVPAVVVPAVAASGVALVPHPSPPAQRSCFQMGTTALTVSMQ
jgi:hypothetical protein